MDENRHGSADGVVPPHSLQDGLYGAQIIRVCLLESSTLAHGREHVKRTYRLYHDIRLQR